MLEWPSVQRCGVEQWQLVGLITRRSQVRVLPPLPKKRHFWVPFLLKTVRYKIGARNLGVMSPSRVGGTRTSWVMSFAGIARCTISNVVFLRSQTFFSQSSRLPQHIRAKGSGLCEIVQQGTWDTYGAYPRPGRGRDKTIL
jgi:hypothetical protein